MRSILQSCDELSAESDRSTVQNDHSGCLRIAPFEAIAIHGTAMQIRDSRLQQICGLSTTPGAVLFKLSVDLSAGVLSSLAACASLEYFQGDVLCQEKQYDGGV